MLSEMTNKFTGTVYLVHYHLLAEKSKLKGTHENGFHWDKGGKV